MPSEYLKSIRDDRSKQKDSQSLDIPVGLESEPKLPDPSIH